ncbi:unnamed protein product [Merluccius merluccius]
MLTRVRWASFDSMRRVAVNFCPRFPACFGVFLGLHEETSTIFVIASRDRNKVGGGRGVGGACSVLSGAQRRADWTEVGARALGFSAARLIGPRWRRASVLRGLSGGSLIGRGGGARRPSSCRGDQQVAAAPPPPP